MDLEPVRHSGPTFGSKQQTHTEMNTITSKMRWYQVDLKMSPLRAEFHELMAGQNHPASDGEWKAKSPVIQRALSSCWPGEEKPLAARLSGVEVSLSSAIKCLPLSPMNHRITGETVHCCLKASVPLIHVSPPAHLCSPLPALVINPGSAPLSLSSLLLYQCLALSSSLYVFSTNYHCPFCLCHDVCPLLEWLSMMDHGLQRHIDTHRTNLCADGQTLIKGVNQQTLSIKKTPGYLQVWPLLLLTPYIFVLIKKKIKKIRQVKAAFGFSGHLGAAEQDVNTTLRYYILHSKLLLSFYLLAFILSCVCGHLMTVCPIFSFQLCFRLH